jgi:hypothetical protein
VVDSDSSEEEKENYTIKAQAVEEDHDQIDFTRNIMNELDDIIDMDGDNADPLDRYIMDENIGNL